MIVFDNSIYASGVATIGRQGSKGNSGNDCNCIYYIPFDLRTSNNVEFCLNRIKNNQLFSSDYIEHLPEEKTYSINDIFYSINGFIYKLNDEFSDFIEIGKIDEIKNTITDVSLNNNLLKFKFDDSKYFCCIYFIDDNSFYPSSDIIDSSLISNAGIDWRNKTINNVLIKYTSKLTGNSNFYKIIN